MFCCICAGSCNHVGEHMYCSLHKPAAPGAPPNHITPFLMPPLQAVRDITVPELAAALDKLGLKAVPK